MFNSAVALGILASWVTTFSRLCRIYVKLRFPGGGSATTNGITAPLLFSLFSGLDWALPLVALAFWWLDHIWLFIPLVVLFSLLDFANTQWGLISRLARDGTG